MEGDALALCRSACRHIRLDTNRRHFHTMLFCALQVGNLCGASTALLALLKRLACDHCRFLSVDPGGYRVPYTHRADGMACARETLRWAGLWGRRDERQRWFERGEGAKEVELVNDVAFDPGEVRRGAVGFMSMRRTDLPPQTRP